MKVACGAICLMCLMCGAPVADAKLITKLLHDVSFADGGEATGSLILNTNSNRITDFDITTTSGNRIPSSFHYLSETARITQDSNESGGSGWPFSFLQINNPRGNIHQRRKIKLRDRRFNPIKPELERRRPAVQGKHWRTCPSVCHATCEVQRQFCTSGISSPCSLT